MPQHGLQRAPALHRGIVEHDADCATRHNSASERRQSGVCISTRRQTTASKNDRESQAWASPASHVTATFLRRASLATAQHLRRCVHTVTTAPARERDRGPSRAGPYVENVAASTGEKNDAITCSWVSASIRPIGPLNRGASNVSAIAASVYTE